MKLISNFLGNGLKAKTIRSTSITFATYGAEQVLRLISNILLTRILFPEAFGIMAIATVVLVGLGMLSDVGISHAIIQNSKGASQQFRNTAWALQILRGIVLWAVACIISYPFAIFYDEPVLFPLLSLLGITLVIKGFSSTATHIANKELNLWRLSVVSISTQILGIIFTVIFAYYNGTVWALVWGSLLSSFLGVLFGHLYLNKGYKHQLAFDKDSFGEIVRFGKWIFFSSIIGFIVNQADKFVIGKYLSMTDLGIYSIAITLALIPQNIMFSLNGKVLFPVYSLLKNEPINKIRNKIYKTKLMLIFILLPIALFLAVCGDLLIDFLYDERYKDAGWMLKVLALGVAIQVSTNIGPFYLGFGHSRLFFYINLVKAITLISSMLLFSFLFGRAGLIIGIAISPLFNYLFEIYFMNKYRLFFWKTDFLLIFSLFILIMYMFPEF